jgi:DUF4097 and DUF4098 domain-containing protein YvlB
MGMKPSFLVAALAAVVACSSAGADQGISKVNGGIDVSPGQHAGDLDTVNGAIHVGADAVVGKADTVNGSITLGSRATATSLKTVNGSVTVNEAARVTGPAATVNGALSVADGADLGAEVSNVNGAIHIRAAHVAGDIETTNADIDLGPNARIDGGIHMNPDTDWWHFFFSQSVPRVVIEPGTVVRGPMHFERTVKLYVSDHATIGAVTGATIVRFAGAKPPG